MMMLRDSCLPAAKLVPLIGTGQRRKLPLHFLDDLMDPPQSIKNEGRMLGRSIFGLIACALVISGCATSTLPVAARMEAVDRPRADEIATANLGESLITRGVVFWSQAVRTSDPAQINIGIGNTVVAPPGIYVLRAEDAKNRYFFGGPPVQTGIVGYEWTGGGVCVSKATGKIAGLFQLRGMCPSNNLIAPSYENLTVPDAAVPDIWRKELIYNGRSGDTIRVIYREYSGDLARPAFTQELQYDLSQQTEIGFREVRLQIETATNTAIRYRVLQTFDGSSPGH